MVNNRPNFFWYKTSILTVTVQQQEPRKRPWQRLYYLVVSSRGCSLVVELTHHGIYRTWVRMGGAELLFSSNLLYPCPISGVSLISSVEEVERCWLSSKNMLSCAAWVEASLIWTDLGAKFIVQLESPWINFDRIFYSKYGAKRKSLNCRGPTHCRRTRVRLRNCVVARKA